MAHAPLLKTHVCSHLVEIETQERLGADPGSQEHAKNARFHSLPWVGWATDPSEKSAQPTSKPRGGPDSRQPPYVPTVLPTAHTRTASLFARPRLRPEAGPRSLSISLSLFLSLPLSLTRCPRLDPRGGPLLRCILRHWCRGTSLMRNIPLLGPYSRTI